jgi:hypothetical protein
MDSGRPTKYTEDMLNKSRQYFNEYESLGDKIPSIAGLSCYLGISRETIHAWKRHEDKAVFSDIVGGILAKQEQVLINKGLTGDFNPSISKLMLVKHGYSDRQETDVTTGGKKITNEWHIHPVTTEKDG